MGMDENVGYDKPTWVLIEGPGPGDAETSRGCFIGRIPFECEARRLPFIADFKFVAADPDPLASSKYRLRAGREDQKEPGQVLRISDQQARSTIPNA